MSAAKHAGVVPYGTKKNKSQGGLMRFSSGPEQIVPGANFPGGNA